GLGYQVTAAASDGRGLAQVQFFSPGGTLVDSTTPYQFPISVPTNAAGAWRLLAVALDTNGTVASTSLTLIVTNAATLQAFEVEPATLVLNSLIPYSLRVWGDFSDGIRRDITPRSAGTRYGTSD